MTYLQTLVHGDCTQLPADQIGHDCLITDPPYSEHVHARMTSCAQKANVKGVRHRDAGFAPLSAELRAYLVRAASVAKRWSIVYADMQGAYLWEQAFARHIRTVPVLNVPEEEDFDGPLGTLPWIRWSSPQQSGDRPPSGCEMLVLGHAQGRMHWGGPGNLVALSHKCERGEDKHTTAKPLDQALDLIAWFTEPGELVYDPCAGRGTLGVACALLDRSYVGFETQEEEARKGLARIEAAKRGELLDRDRDRFQRWLVSVGLPKDAPMGGVKLRAFRKGKAL